MHDASMTPNEELCLFLNWWTTSDHALWACKKRAKWCLSLPHVRRIWLQQSPVWLAWTNFISIFVSISKNQDCPPLPTKINNAGSWSDHDAAKLTFERAQCVIVSKSHPGGNWNVSVAVVHNLGCLLNNWPFISGVAAWQTQATNIWLQSFIAFRGNNNWNKLQMRAAVMSNWHWPSSENVMSKKKFNAHFEMEANAAAKAKKFGCDRPKLWQSNWGFCIFVMFRESFVTLSMHCHHSESSHSQTQKAELLFLWGLKCSWKSSDVKDNQQKMSNVQIVTWMLKICFPTVLWVIA